MSIKETVKKSYSAVKNSVSSAADKVKTEYKKGQLKNDLSELYETLGEVRYSELISGGEISEESVKICEEITRVKREIEKLELQGDKNKNSCKVCGKKLPDNITYCPYCGTKTDEKE